jgi:phospholipase C
MSTQHITRRQLIGAAAVGAAGLTALERPLASLAKPKPSGGGAPFDHVVVVMMENRSFDHFLGWLPGADGRQAGPRYPDRNGVLRPTHALAPDFQGCGHPDPDHSYGGGRDEYDGGRCDGWLRAGENDDYAIGYYTQKDLAFFGQAVPQWSTFSRYFAAMLSETFPNRIYQHAAQTDRIKNTYDLSTLPTLWDSLAAAGLSGRYYYSDVPFLALWGPKYVPIGRPFPAFLQDCASGDLPAVAFVDPRFDDENTGTSGDDHPHADVRGGESFMNQIYKAVTTGPKWSSTVLLFTYDEWGGFFDHVPPPAAPFTPATAAAGDTDGRRGFRIPTLLVSPYARRQYVGTKVYDHCSVLKMIQTRWGLPPLTIRDAQANDLGLELTATPDTRQPPQYAVPEGPFGQPCVPAPPVEEDWMGLKELAASSGWVV